QSGKGALYGFRTTDQDNDGYPDRLWNTEGALPLDKKVFFGPVMADLDNDGYLETLVLDEHQTLHVFSHDGQEIGNYRVGDTDWSESQIAVADVDNDGYPEVFFGIRKDDNGKVALLRW